MTTYATAIPNHAVLALQGDTAAEAFARAARFAKAAGIRATDIVAIGFDATEAHMEITLIVPQRVVDAARVRGLLGGGDE